MKKLLCSLLFICCLTTVVAQQTYRVTGIVTDEKDRAIPGATVFLADSRKATASDKDGLFTLWQIQPGKYNLVVKMIGYEAVNYDFTLQNKDARFRIKLKEDNIELKAVNISALSLSERKKHLATFTRCFLGISDNAAQCKLLNTDVIVFSYDKKRNILKARSDDFRIIENRALGYRIKYLLNNFVYDVSVEEALTSFDGTLFYEELDGNPRQRRKWDIARAEVYLGSSQHFFRSLYSNTLEQEGFVTFAMLNKSVQDRYLKINRLIPASYYRPVNLSKVYVKKVDENFKALDLGRFKADSTELWVVYKPGIESYQYLTAGVVIPASKWLPNGQKTVVRPVFDRVSISKNGDVSPIGGMVFVGFWMWGKMAWALPSDYELPAELHPNIKTTVAQDPETN